MTVIEEIINELSDSKKSLTDPLLKTKILATRIGNLELMKWTANELTGYKDNILPSYRIGKANITCTMQQGFSVQHNVPFPLLAFKEDFRKKILEFRFDDSILTLESQERENKNGSIGKEFGPDMCAIVTREAIEAGQDFEITSMKIMVHVSQITQVLAQVRGKLLDFILQVEKELPNLDEIIKKKLLIKENINEKLGQIYHQTIINTSGYGNTITTGEKNTVTATTNIAQGSTSELKRELEKHSVPITDIDEILEIVQQEEPNRKLNKFGQNVNTWIQKMISKTLDGTWQIGTAAAGGLLVELIKSYYGLGS